MFGYLEDIFDNVNFGAEIISEQHDTSKIDTAGGAAASLAARIASLRSGGWDAAEYGITAEAQIARLEATKGDPVALAREDEELRKRALSRASLDTSTGKVAVMVAGRPPWHRLGVNVAQAVNSGDAARLARLDWKVSKSALSYEYKGAWRSQADSFAITRDDTGACLGVVGSRYKAIQNDQGFAFLDEVMAEHGARYITAGAVHGGRKVWMQVELPRQSFAVGKGDEVKAYALFTNPHDGSGVAECFPTSERVVCANTLRVALKNADGLRIRHTGDIRSKIAAGRKALGVSVKGFGELREKAAILARTPLTEPLPYVNAVLDDCLPISAQDVKIGAETLARNKVAADLIAPEDFEECVRQNRRNIETRGDILADVLKRLEGERCRVNGISGTAWAGLNAFTEHADYAPPSRRTGTAESQYSRKFESVLDGDGDKMKQAAFTRAMQLAR